MRYLLVFLFLLPVSPIFAQTDGDSVLIAFQQKQSPYVGKQFPDFSATLNDTVITAGKMKGKTVFVNFWFASCIPCVAEFEGLNKLYAKMKDRPNLLFLSFTYETPEKVKEIRAAYAIMYPVISITPEECKRLIPRLGFPTNMIVSNDGKIVFALTGGATDKERASRTVLEQYYPRIIEQLNR